MPALDLIIGDALPLHDSNVSPACDKKSAQTGSIRDRRRVEWGLQVKGWCWMPEWIGSVLFLSAVGLSGTKIAVDFGNRGFRGYAMLLLLILVYASAIAVGYL